MALKPEEIAWLEEITGVRPPATPKKPDEKPLLEVIQDAEVDDAIKVRMLGAARKAIESDVGVIQVGEDFDVGMLGGFLKRKFTMASIADDPNEEYDAGHDAKKLAGALPPEQYNLLIKAQAVIARQSQILQNAYSEGTGRKLFTDVEISDAIWEPLKRRKLIPENAIPDRYSEVARTFGGAAKQYETRLAAYTQALPDNQALLDGLGIAKDFFEAGGAIATGVIGDLTAIGSPLMKDPAKVTAILKGVQTTLVGGATMAEKGLKAFNERKLSDPETVADLCKELIKGAQALIGAGFSGSDSAGKALGKAISAGVGMAANAVVIGAKAKKGKYEEILADIGDMVAASFTIYAQDLVVKNPNATTDARAKALTPTELGTVIANEFKIAAKVLSALKDPNPQTLLDALLEGLRSAAQVSSNYLASHVKEPDLKDEATARDARTKGQDPSKMTPEEYETFKKTQAFKDYQKDFSSDSFKAGNVITAQWTAQRDKADKGFAELSKKIADLQKLSAEDLKKAVAKDPSLKALADALKAQTKVVEEEGLADFKEELVQSEKDFRALLNHAERGDSDEDVEKIEALISQLKRDQMILDFAFQIQGQTAAVVAAFLPQAGIAVSAIELIKNLHKAQMHLTAYFEWRDNVADARSAMSVQVEAMTNRMDLSLGQSAEACWKALEEAIKLVGGVLSVAGPFAPAGHAVAATMGAVSGARAAIVKYYRENELSKAFKLFLSARSNPEDRKTLRAAIRTNPTLAKYAIAYGAEFENNPVARNVLNKCGLTNDVLNSKDANADKVVKYLEAMYPEDPVLLREIDKPARWYPGPVELSAISVGSFVGAATGKPKHPLQPGAGQPLVQIVTRWDRDNTAYRAAYDAWQKADQAVIAAPNDATAAKTLKESLHAMQDAGDRVLDSVTQLANYLKRPNLLATDGKPHESFNEYMSHLMPIALNLQQKYRREIGAMAQQEGARPSETAVKVKT